LICAEMGLHWSVRFSCSPTSNVPDLHRIHTTNLVLNYQIHDSSWCLFYVHTVITTFSWCKYIARLTRNCCKNMCKFHCTCRPSVIDVRNGSSQHM
jgi:hypothetical protein